MADAARADAPGQGQGWPVAESADLGRYLEDTITIDWQTPTVSQRASALLGPADGPEDRVRRLFRSVRDEISHGLDVESPVATCSASSVLRAGQGLCFAKSHLLAAYLRFAGFPTGFCYARLVDDVKPGAFVLHGFNAVWWAQEERWLFLDASGRKGTSVVEARFEPPWSLPFEIDPEPGERLLPLILRRPAPRIVDLLERAPNFESILRNLPDAL